MPLVDNVTPNIRVSFIPPTSVNAAQKKGGVTVGTSNKSTFEGWFASYDILYFDDISSGDTKQDWIAVCLIFEGAIMKLVKDYPHVKSVYIQSDHIRQLYRAPSLGKIKS